MALQIKLLHWFVLVLHQICIKTETSKSENVQKHDSKTTNTTGKPNSTTNLKHKGQVLPEHHLLAADWRMAYDKHSEKELHIFLCDLVRLSKHYI